MALLTSSELIDFAYLQSAIKRNTLIADGTTRRAWETNIYNLAAREVYEELSNRLLLPQEADRQEVDLSEENPVFLLANSNAKILRVFVKNNENGLSVPMQYVPLTKLDVDAADIDIYGGRYIYTLVRNQLYSSEIRESHEQPKLIVEFANAYLPVDFVGDSDESINSSNQIPSQHREVIIWKICELIADRQNDRDKSLYFREKFDREMLDLIRTLDLRSGRNQTASRRHTHGLI